MQKLHILFFGTSSQTSVLALQALIKAGYLICGVVLPSPPGGTSESLRRLPAPRFLPISLGASNQSIQQIAWEQQIPLFQLSRIDTAALTILASLQPDLGCVACFPLRLPPRLLRQPRYGWLNLHPALLPAHRGPIPLFWTFHAGERLMGVTIHWMDEGFDTGPIALQRQIEIPLGCCWGVAEALLDRLGAELLAEAVALCSEGRLPRIPQAAGSYESWPDPDAFIIKRAWSVERAWHFSQGVSGWQQPLFIQNETELIEVQAVLGYHQGVAGSQRSSSLIEVELANGYISIQRRIDI